MLRRATIRTPLLKNEREAGFLPYISTLSRASRRPTSLSLPRIQYSPKSSPADLLSISRFYLAAFHSLQAAAGRFFVKLTLLAVVARVETYHFSFHAVAGKGDQTVRKALGNSIKPSALRVRRAQQNRFLGVPAAFASTGRIRPRRSFSSIGDCGAGQTIAGLPGRLLQVEGIPTGLESLSLCRRLLKTGNSSGPS